MPLFIYLAIGVAGIFAGLLWSRALCKSEPEPKAVAVAGWNNADIRGLRGTSSDAVGDRDRAAKQAHDLKRYRAMQRQPRFDLRGIIRGENDQNT